MVDMEQALAYAGADFEEPKKEADQWTVPLIRFTMGKRPALWPS